MEPYFNIMSTLWNTMYQSALQLTDTTFPGSIKTWKNVQKKETII